MLKKVNPDFMSSRVVGGGALKLIAVLLLGFSIGYGYTLNPVTETDRQVDAYFFEAMEKAKNVDYLEALSITRKISQLVPDHPAGYLFSSAILSWIISDFYNYAYTDEFLDEINKTIDRAKAMIQDSRFDPWGYIYVGGAYGFRGIYYSTIGSFYSAFVDGVRGNFELNKAISLNPEIYDNYFGTGTFDFWKAYYSGKFFWLGTSDVNKQKGIDKINLAINYGKYTTLEAEFSLVRIYLVDGRYQDAIDKAKKMIKVSPRSVKARRFMGIAYYEKKEYQQALNTFVELRDIIDNHRLKTSAALLEVNINIAKTYREMKQNSQALSLLVNSRVHYNNIEDDNDFLEELLEEYERLEEEIRSNLAHNN